MREVFPETSRVLSIVAPKTSNEANLDGPGTTNDWRVAASAFIITKEPNPVLIDSKLTKPEISKAEKCAIPDTVKEVNCVDPETFNDVNDVSVALRARTRVLPVTFKDWVKIVAPAVKVSNLVAPDTSNFPNVGESAYKLLDTFSVLRVVPPLTARELDTINEPSVDVP